MSRMLKGCERKMVVVQGQGNGAFEVAYFILRRECEKKVTYKQDLLEEANRIINENRLPGVIDRRGGWRRKSGLLLWFLGFLCGSGCSLLLLCLAR